MLDRLRRSSFAAIGSGHHGDPGLASGADESVTRLLINAKLAMLVLVGSALLVTLSPFPASAGTFADDDGNVHEAAIEALAQAGITQGCGPDRFCPDRHVTRGEMAAFLTRAFSLKPSSKNYFVDHTGSTFQGDINAIAKAGITIGCNPPMNDRFCAEGAVTRAQMASFLIRAMGKERMAKGKSTFEDSDGNPHGADIQRMAKLNITKGCNPPANTFYCPDSQITRGEMATFLARALNLPLHPPTPDNTGDGGDHAGDGGSGDDSGDGGTFEPEPITIPSNAIRIKPGASIQSAVDKAGSGATFVLEPGVYSGQSVKPNARTTFIGLDGAAMSGQGKTFAFRSNAKNVTIYGLEITGYKPKSRDGVIHGDGDASGWRVEGNEIHNNAEVGVKTRSGWLVRANHLHHNGRYGVQGSGSGVVFEGNDLSYNSTDFGATGASGGSKFILSDNLVLRNNHVHNNYGNGLWVDINNTNTLIEGNKVVDNLLNGINIEISCGATIRNNDVSGNGFGSKYPSWMTGSGILVSNTPNVTVTGNRLSGNAKGIGAVHWDHPNRKAVDKCTPELRNFEVSNNSITQSGGAAAGIDAKIDLNAVWTSWGNQFSNNSYSLSNSAGFRWKGDWASYAQWKQAGQN
ncbi:hypothetical protein BH23ACT5_BH23ACT5_14760 [soil metagenome]